MNLSIFCFCLSSTDTILSLKNKENIEQADCKSILKEYNQTSINQRACETDSKKEDSYGLIINQNMSLNDEDIIQSFLDPILIVFYSITITLAVFGNLSVLLVMSCGFRSSRLSITKFLFNLAIFNLIMCIFCVPSTYYGSFVKFKWILMPLMCPLKSFFQNLSINGSILSLTYLSIDRYQAVAHPLTHKSKSTKSKMNLYFALIWLISSLIAFLQLLNYKCFKRSFFDENINLAQFYCYCIDWDPFLKYTAEYYLIFCLLTFCQSYLLPIIIMLVMYSKLTNILWKRADKNYKKLHESVSASIRSRNVHENEKFKTSKVSQEFL